MAERAFTANPSTGVQIYAVGTLVDVEPVGNVTVFDPPQAVIATVNLGTNYYGAPINGSAMREIVGQKTYEYTNHLGNVLLTTSDKKLKENDAYLFIPTWTDVSNMNITSTTLTNTSSTLGWTDPGECYSVQGITGDGYVEHTLNADPYYSRNVGVGLSYTNGTGHALNTIDYCIWQAWTGQQLQVRVGGSLVYSVPGSFSGSQVIRIERIGSTIYFKVDGTTVYSTTEYGSGTLYADVAISRPGHSVQDLKIGGGTNDLTVSADVRSWSDYYPYGMAMVGRNTNLSDYRFGFNDMEMDNEMKGNGNSLDFGARIYDPRLGKFFSIDPRASDFPSWSPYLFAGDSPIRFVDEYGEGPGDRVKKSKSFKKPGYKKPESKAMRTESTEAAMEFMDCSEHVSRVLSADGLIDITENYSTDKLYDLFNNTEKDKWTKSERPQIGDVVLWTASTSGNDWGHTAIVEDFNEKTGRVLISHHTRYKGVSGYENKEYPLSYFQKYGASFYRPTSESGLAPADPTLIYGPYWISKMVQVSAKGNGGSMMESIMATSIPGAYSPPDVMVPRNYGIPTEAQIDIAISTVDKVAAGALRVGNAIGNAAKNIGNKIGGMFKKAPPVQHKSVRFL